MAKDDATLEVEMKFPLAEGTTWAALTKSLRQRGARRTQVQPRREEDHYLNAPDRDFARTDEALRLRRIGSANFVTYKGPKRDPLTKTRIEIEVSLAKGQEVAEDFLRLLRALGYKDVAVVRKERQIYRMADLDGFAVEVCLDDVSGLGKFTELEIIAPASKLEAARNVLMGLAKELGLTKSERRSYLELLLASRERNRIVHQRVQGPGHS
jgi:adenylate cyclase, class 2